MLKFTKTVIEAIRPNLYGLFTPTEWQKKIVEFTLCSYGFMSVINYRPGSRGKMGGENLWFT